MNTPEGLPAGRARGNGDFFAIGSRPPGRALVGLIVGTVFALALAVNGWAVHERRAGTPSLVSGSPGFEAAALPDPSGNLDFAAVSGRAAAFQALSGTPLANPPRTVWYRLRIRNPSDSDWHAVVCPSNDYLLEAECYIPRVGAPPLVERGGASVRWYDRTVRAPKVAFRIDVPARAQAVAYVRIADAIKQPASFLLWTDAAVFERTVSVYGVELVGFFSIWAALVLYNAFLYAVLRRRDYGLYVAYALSIGLGILTSSDVSTMLVGWPAWPLRGMVVTLALNLAGYNLVQFSRAFLETERLAPALDAVLKAFGRLALLGLLGIPAWLSAKTAWTFEASDFLMVMALAISVVIAGGVLFARRVPQAGLYLLAFVPLIAGAMYMLGDNLGEPVMRNNRMPVLSANAVELIFLALALAWRYRRLSDEAAQLHADYTLRLESEVARQTGNLREANESLSKAVREKDRILTILGHDLRGPAQNLYRLCQAFAEDPAGFSSGDVGAMAGEIEEACRAQLELLETLLAWGRAKAGDSSAAQLSSAYELVHRAIGLHSEGAARKQIAIDLQVDPTLTVWSDPEAAEAILRNLVGNALKFTHPGGRICIDARLIDRRTEIAVRDNGVGIAPARLKELLSGPVPSARGTRSEKGSGVGLMLCQELAQANGGELRIETELKRGTSVTLTLAAAAPSPPTDAAQAPGGHPAPESLSSQLAG